jgi:putative flippase GtrA
VADSCGVSPITARYRRFAGLLQELAKFGVIGTIGAGLDLGGAAMLHGSAGLGPLLAKTISTVAATTFAYAGNRVWTFRHRANAGLAREYLIFFALNGAGLLIALLVIGFTEYSLGMHSQLAYNLAQVTGTAIGTLFRYWAYKKWVFLPRATPSAQPPTGPQVIAAVGLNAAPQVTRGSPVVVTSGGPPAAARGGPPAAARRGPPAVVRCGPAGGHVR